MKSNRKINVISFTSNNNTKNHICITSSIVVQMNLNFIYNNTVEPHYVISKEISKDTFIKS